MRVHVSCWQCGFDKLPRIEHYLPLADDAVFEVDCPIHGKSVVDLQNLRFELFFDSAILALGDERTREAVLDLSASLERFLEFYVDFARAHHKISESEFETFWKSVAVQSERQIGAFLFAYLLTTGTASPYPKKSHEFRNRVVHQGYIPSVEEVVGHAEDLRVFMYHVIDDAKQQNTQAIHVASAHQYDRRLPSGPPTPPGGLVSGLTLPTIVGIWHIGDRRTVPEEVTRLRTWYAGHCSRCGAATH